MSQMFLLHFDVFLDRLLNVFIFITLPLIKAIPLFAGSFAYIDSSYKARLESSLLPWKPFHQSVGLCLRFQYLMATKSKSNLKVFLKENKQDVLALVWQIVGFHGKEWSVAQVALPGAVESQVSELNFVSFCVLCVTGFQIKVVETFYGSVIIKNSMKRILIPFCVL